MWKGSRDLVKFVYQITKNKDFCKDFSLTDQIRRAASFGHVEYRGRV
jgi:four helix bundle protein